MRCLFTILLAGILVSCGASKDKKALPTHTDTHTHTPVRTQVLQQEQITQAIKVLGIVASQTEVGLAFKTGGIIEHTYAKEGQTVEGAEIAFDARPNKKMRGFISQIAQTASPTTGTYEVEVQIENLEKLTLINGFVGQANIQPQDTKTYTVVPPQP